MQPIIDPIDTDLLEKELPHSRLLRMSHRAGNEIYVVTAHEAPNVMREIGRLREIAFRTAGGGTGLPCDIDRFDTMERPCHQLIVWDPRRKEILGGYRYITGKEIQFLPDGTPDIATSHLFRFSPRFLENYLPHTVELGRSFVRIESQSTREGSHSVYTLDNLWDGLGALTVIHPEIKYFFGKVTMYPGFALNCRQMVHYVFRKHFPDRDNLVEPIVPVDFHYDTESFKQMFSGQTFIEDYRTLQHAIRACGLNIPPLVNAYMSLSPTMKVFGTAVNHEFGNVEETGILIAFSEIIEAKKRRHIDSYQPPV